MSVWIDLTDFLNWKGNLTGIQRIQFNISKLYAESGTDVKFFVYKENNRSFHQVDFIPEQIVKSGIVLDGRLSHSKIEKFKKIISNKLRHSKIGKILEPKSVNIESIFERDDLVLIMGGMWLGNYIDDLITCKSKSGFKLVHFIFDMIPSFLPGYVVDWLPECFNNYNRKVFSIAEGILSISESTSNDVRRFIKNNKITNNPSIRFVRIGEGIDIANDSTVSQVANLTSGDYILSVSTVEGRKNHTALFYILKEAKARGIKLPKLVIVGRDGWLTNDIRSIIKNDIDAKEGMLLLNNVNDNELDWLYKNCKFTIFPSFYEGWGMPIAESLSYGKLCLSSNTSSMPEIAGDLIDYFSPYDTGSILNCVVKYLDKKELHEKEQRIKSEYCQTSWTKMHKDIDAFVQDIILG